MALLLKKVERPRDLKWYQAGAMLYGDWGTSKAYVLGIAFALSGHASWFFLGLMSALTALVGFCYIIICRLHPEGGGVYSSVKSRSKTLAVIGGYLLIVDYIVTASLSALDAFHYFNFENAQVWAVLSILIIGLINWIGPSKGGNIAAIIAVFASVIAGVLFLSTLPHLPRVQLSLPEGTWFGNWKHFAGIVIALSGVEAVANMTGIMKEPVARTSRNAILPVLLEVSFLTFLLGIAMNAIPGLSGHTEDMLRAIGAHYIGPWYGSLISLAFGFLLLSAVNTAISDIVSIQFMMARDGELPAVFAKLNRFGMPMLALVVGTVLPIVVLILEQDIVHLASLYAIGVVGAITLNLWATATYKTRDMTFKERLLLSFASILLFLIWLTVAFEKRGALVFAATIVGAGLTLRFIAKRVVPAPALQVAENVNLLTVSEAKEISALYPSSLLVGLKGLNLTLLEEAALRTKALGQNSVYLSYVEEAPPSHDLPTEIEPSQESVDILSKAQEEMEKHGITAIPIWQLGVNPGKLIARAARELEVGAVMIGTTKRSALTNLLRGEVLKNLTHNLPKKCHLVISG